MVRQNSFAGLSDSERVLIGAAGSGSASTVEFYGSLGLDFVFVDLEHSGFSAWDSPKLEEFTARADLAGIDLMVRLPSGEPGDHPPLIRKVLDTGVRNVLIPRVETAEEVERAVEASKFRYDGGLGDRGIGGGRAVGRQGVGMTPEYIEAEDEEVRVGIMIENTTAIDNLGEILEVPELGFAFVGNMDLSHSLGRPTDIGHDDVQEAVGEIEDAFGDSTVPLGAMFFERGNVREYVDRGYQLLMGGSMRGAATQYFDDLLTHVDDEVEAYHGPG